MGIERNLREICYTPESANKTLPDVREIVERIVELKKEIDQLAGTKRSEHIDELSLQISKLNERGIELKDLDIGLVDFPAKRFDEQVCLCWKLGEPEVLYWHDLKSGFRGRRLLRPEALKAR
jgi:hypothetical protein